jgi:hypothetical protein
MSVVQSLPNLPPAIARHTLYVLTEALPPPISNLPEERAARDEAAIAAVADLRPATAFEARLAARTVAADAYAMDCLRLAGLPGKPPEDARRCKSQAATMMREAGSALRSLQSLQAARAKTEAEAAPAPSEAPATAAPPPLDIAAEADRYAQRHPEQAALIRRQGCLPDGSDRSKLSPALVEAIVTGTSPVLRALDRTADHPLAAAA